MRPSTAIAFLASLLSAVCMSSLLWAGPLPLGPSPSSFEQRYGIVPVALRLTGAGHMLDFRFKVLDPAKAATLIQHNSKPRLLDPLTGRDHDTPSMAKVGALRQTDSKLRAGKVYFIMFSNQHDALKAGDKVTIAFDDVKLENQIIQ